MIQFKNKIVVFSGFRSTILEKYIKKNGGTIANSLVQDTDILIIYGKKV